MLLEGFVVGFGQHPEQAEAQNAREQHELVGGKETGQEELAGRGDDRSQQEGTDQILAILHAHQRRNHTEGDDPLQEAGPDEDRNSHGRREGGYQRRQVPRRHTEETFQRRRDGEGTEASQGGVPERSLLDAGVLGRLLARSPVGGSSGRESSRGREGRQ